MEALHGRDKIENLKNAVQAVIMMFW